MKIAYEFSIIYSFDCKRSQPVGYFLPPKKQRKKWKQTEGDEQYDLEHLGASWEKGKHRKLCAILTRKEFEEFVEHCDLHAEDVETMGALGTPGGDPCGISPAISFNGAHQYAGSGYVNAYVTPIPDRDLKRYASEADWVRVRRAVLTLWGS